MPLESSLCHSLTNPEAAANVLAAATQTLTQYPFDFCDARILSAQDEGVFGWVAANYLLENFIKVGPVAPTHWLTSTSTSRSMAGWASGSGQGRGRWGPWTWGAPPHRSPSRWPAQLRIRPMRSSCGSTAHSFLCYGRDQVLWRLLASALQVPSTESFWR